MPWLTQYCDDPGLTLAPPYRVRLPKYAGGTPRARLFFSFMEGLGVAPQEGVVRAWLNDIGKCSAVR